MLFKPSELNTNRNNVVFFGGWGVRHLKNRFKLNPLTEIAIFICKWQKSLPVAHTEQMMQISI